MSLPQWLTLGHLGSCPAASLLSAEVRSETTTARSIAKSDSRSRLGASELGAVDAKSMGRSDSRSRLAGLEAGGPASSSGAEAGGQAGANHTAAAPTSAAAGAAPPPVVATAAAAAGHAPQWEAHATSSPRLMRDISLAPDRTQHMLQAVLPTEPRLPHTQLSDITFQPLPAPVPLETIPSGAATRGSGSVALEPSVGPFHVRVPSSDSLATGRAARHHVKSFSADSGHGLSPSDGRSSPAPWSGRSTPTHRQLAVASGAEHLLSFKLHDYLDGRSISSVVPLSTPNDTSEPQVGCWWVTAGGGQQQEQQQEICMAWAIGITTARLRREAYGGGPAGADNSFRILCPAAAGDVAGAGGGDSWPAAGAGGRHAAAAAGLPPWLCLLRPRDQQVRVESGSSGCRLAAGGSVPTVACPAQI